MIKFAKVEKRLLGTENDYGWFPIIALSGKIGIDDITNSIMNRCTLTEVDITACLKAFQRVVIEYLKNGLARSALPSVRVSTARKWATMSPEAERWRTRCMNRTARP